MKKQIKKATKQIFLEHLPKYKNGNINWRESINYKVKGIYDYIEFEVKIIKYEIKKNRLTIMYNSKEFEILTGSFKTCRLGKLLNKTTSDFKIEIGTIFKDNKRDLVIIDKEYRAKYKDNGSLKQNKKYYKYTCNKCGWTEGWIEESQLLSDRKYGCACCRGFIVVEGINDISTTATELISYFQGGYDEAKLYTKSSTSKIKPICPDCGRVKSKKMAISTIYKYKSIGCSCSDKISYPNKFMLKILQELNIEFKTEYNPTWIKPKAYDFYIPSMNLIIEMDGEFHKKDNPMSGQTKEESKSIDDYKDRLANENGIEVIRIDCDYGSKDRFEYVKCSILNNNKLNELFDLNKVNWKNVMEFALCNLAKIACNYKKNNSDLTTKDIAKIMKLSRNAVTNYLKEGTKLGWCEYCAKEESKKGKINGGRSNAKPVEIFKNGISLGIFPSCTELEHRSEDLFGEKLDHKSISAVCLGSRNTYKGYTFRYLSQQEIQEMGSEELKQII